MALTADRKVPYRAGTDFSTPVKAGAKIHAGAIVVLDVTAQAVPGYTATGLRVLGVAQAAADNSEGINGAVWVPVRTGVFQFAQPGAGISGINRSKIGKQAYLVDDETLSSDDGTVDDGSVTRSAAGLIVDAAMIPSEGFWVRIGI